VSSVYVQDLLQQVHDDTSCTVEDIAKALSHINRFCGRTDAPFNVARHSIVVMLLLPPEASPHARLLALLHDAHEIYVGDIPRPFKRIIFDIHQTVTAEIDEIIFNRYKLSFSAEDMRQVQLADDITNRIEYETIHMQRFVPRMEFALGTYTDHCAALRCGTVKNRVAKLLSDRPDPSYAANQWMYEWRELICAIAYQRGKALVD
jgi:hypothetical protein